MLDLATNRQLQQHHHNKKTNEKEKGKIHLSSFVYCALSNRIFVVGRWSHKFYPTQNTPP